MMCFQDGRAGDSGDGNAGTNVLSVLSVLSVSAGRYPGSLPPSARNPAGVASGTTDRTDRTDRTDGKRIPLRVGDSPPHRGEVPF